MRHMPIDITRAVITLRAATMFVFRFATREFSVRRDADAMIAMPLYAMSRHERICRLMKMP